LIGFYSNFKYIATDNEEKLSENLHDLAVADKHQR